MSTETKVKLRILANNLKKKELLRVENLTVSFSVQGRSLQAVRGISFSVNEGEAVGIVGESGCGKSAAVQAITRLTPASQVSGKVFFEGDDLLLKNPKELRLVRGKKIGMVFQDPMTSLNPTMKIGAQIVEALLYHNLANYAVAKHKALDLLKVTGVPEPEVRFNQYPHQLSGGMRQRVLIAIALICNPRLLIADEPTTALDVTLQAQILEMLKQMQQHFQTSLLLITHDLGVVSTICEKVLVMYAGKIVEEGTVEEVLLNPKHPYTQMLLRSLPRLSGPKSNELVPIDGAPPNLLNLPKGCAFKDRCPYAMDLCEKEPPMRNSAACWRVE
ncbi:MAG: ABC transporter ATP-binding protein [Chlamydiota bacterium]